MLFWPSVVDERANLAWMARLGFSFVLIFHRCLATLMNPIFYATSQLVDFNGFLMFFLFGSCREISFLGLRP